MDNNNKVYDAVLIIGNGFDLHLGLKTSYLDFIQSSFFNEILIGNKFARYLKSKFDLQNWIDVENELAEYSRTILEEKDDNDEFYSEYVQLTESLVNYLKNIDSKSVNKLCEGYFLLKRVCHFSCLILDFNYTNTIQDLLEEISKEKSTFSVNHVKVHGDLENGIIFGVDDKAKINSKHIFLKKSVNKNFTSRNYSKDLIDSQNLGIFGHSLGETDHMYFRDYFQSACKLKSQEKNYDITFYFYKERGRLKLHEQLDVLTKQQIAKFKQNSSVTFKDTFVPWLKK